MRQPPMEGKGGSGAFATTNFALAIETGLTLGGLLNVIFLPFVGRHPRSQFAHRWVLYLVSEADSVCNSHYSSNWIRYRSFRGPPWGPKARKSIDKSAAGFMDLFVFPNLAVHWRG